jgi:diacylglycerol kinase (ATP)
MTLPADAVPVAFGGDGTVHEVSIGCLERHLPLGVLPVGSGDDFAYALGLDRHDFDAALRVLIDGTTRAVDVGCVGAEPFMNSFGTGFDADVARRIVHAPRYYRNLGKYLYGIATAMRDFRVLSASVEIDGAVVHDGETLLVAVQNGPRTGGSFLFAPEAQPDDGTFEVVVAGAFGRLGTLGILPKVMRGRHVGHRRIGLFRGRSVRVLWSAPVAGHTDGEVLPFGDAFDVTMQPGRLRVLAPPSSAAARS